MHFNQKAKKGFTNEQHQKTIKRMLTALGCLEGTRHFLEAWKRIICHEIMKILENSFDQMAEGPKKRAKACSLPSAGWRLNATFLKFEKGLFVI